MRNFIKGLFFLVLTSVTIAGCKLDPPIYPTGSVSSGTITLDLNVGGSPITITNLVYFDAQPVDITLPEGSLLIAGGSQETSNAFTLTAAAAGPGSYDINQFIVNKLEGSGTGTVTITTYNITGQQTGTIAGTFNGVTLVNPETSEVFTDVSGSFQITL